MEAGPVTYWNEAAEEMFGYPAQEAIGRVLHRFIVPPRFLEAHNAVFSHFVETGEGAAVGKTLELAALKKDGTEFPIELSLSAVMISDRWNAIGILRDITERKNAELKLHESERRFSDLLGNVELVSMMLDRESRITYCNDYLLRLTGWQREEVIGKNWWEHFLPPEI